MLGLLNLRVCPVFSVLSVPFTLHLSALRRQSRTSLACLRPGKLQAFLSFDPGLPLRSDGSVRALSFTFKFGEADETRENALTALATTCTLYMRSKTRGRGAMGGGRVLAQSPLGMRHMSTIHTAHARHFQCYETSSSLTRALRILGES